MWEAGQLYLARSTTTGGVIGDEHRQKGVGIVELTDGLAQGLFDLEVGDLIALLVQVLELHPVRHPEFIEIAVRIDAQ